MKTGRFLIIVMFILILGSSCLKKPGLPQWYSTYSFPVLHDTIRIGELISDSEHIVIGPDSLIEFHVTSDIDTFYPVEDMSISNIDTTIKAGFGRLVVRNIVSRAITVTWDSILTNPVFSAILDTIHNHPNDSVRIFLPNIVPDTVMDTTDTLPKFSWAHINYMSLTIHLQNDFPITISPYHLWLYSIDGSDTSLIFEGGRDSVSPRERIDTTLTISDVFMTNRLRVVEFMGVPGGDSIYASYSNYFYVQVSLDSIVIDSARALFPGLTFTDTLNINPRFEWGSIDTVVLDTGHLYLGIYNPLDVPISHIRIFSDNIISRGRPFDDTVSIAARETTDITIDLTNRMIVFGDSGLSFIVTSNIDSNWLTIRSNDSVSVFIFLDTISVHYFSGNFDSVEKDIPQIDTILDIPDTLNFHLTHAYLTGEIVQTMNFAPDINLTMTVISDTDSVSQDFHVRLNPGRPGSPGHTSLDFDLGNLFRNPPREVRLTGNVLINGRGSTYRNAWVTGHAEIFVPLTLVFSPDTLISDTARDSLNVDSSLISHLDTATIFIRLKNRVPLGFSARFTMTSDLGDTLVKTFVIPPAPHDTHGFATGEKDTTLIFTVTHEEAHIFEAPEQISWIEIYIPQTDTVSIRTSDYIRFDVFGKIIARIGE